MWIQAQAVDVPSHMPLKPELDGKDQTHHKD
jgi:hypothetical protein